MRRSWHPLSWAILLTLAMAAPGAALPSFDFRTSAGGSGWQALHDLAVLARTPDGLQAVLSGSDPYFAGPPRDYPAGRMLWLNLRLRSDSGGTCQVFYFRDGTPATERASVRFAVRGGDWVTARVPLEPLGPRFRLRIDPPGESGTCVFERLWFEERHQYPEPDWPTPAPAELEPTAPSLVSGDLRLTHHPSRFGGFALDLAGIPFGYGPTRPLLGYLTASGPRWWPFTEAADAVVVSRENQLLVTLHAVDPEGGHWEFEQAFAPGAVPGTLTVRTSITVDRDRDVLHLPPLTVVAGTSASGTNKQQALLAGVEYLENEPSSSEADLEGPQSRRQVVDVARLTFPLAAVVDQDRYLALTWDVHPQVAVVFDSPDRLLRSGRHLFGLLLPGSDGVLREEGSLVPYDALRLGAHQRLEVHAALLGGRGDTAVAAVRHYASLHPLPPLPPIGPVAAYYRLAARGWLDSSIRDGDRYRHAAGAGNFGAQPAADAACQMDWLADRVEDAALAARLRTAATAALAQVPINDWHASGVGHVRYPVAPLVYGRVAENAGAALLQGRALLRRFDGPGTVRYVAPSGGLDYARTHWTNEANGLTAQVIASVLRAAAFSGDPSLEASGLLHLRALAKFKGTVPRGAQTWEIPLHTPDILASAHLVDAYVLGYEATGEPAFLDEARYWAWTGVPFVYLRSPTDGPVGPYATTPVLGATQWVAPNWIGLPVQWCGLVYADALHRLARHDPAGPWAQLAGGIVASGIQQTYPESHAAYLGLLPDSFTLRAQQRNPANINPATLLAPAARALGAIPFYDTHTFLHHGVRVHVAGDLRDVREDAEGFSFQVAGWAAGTHWILLNGVTPRPAVRINGRDVPLSPPHTYAPGSGRLILQVEGSPRIDVVLPARTALRIVPADLPGTAVVSWPAQGPGLRLETTLPVAPLSAWEAVATPLPVENGRQTLTISTRDDPGRLFRLRAPGG